MRCPDDLELQSFFDEELNFYRRSRIKKHLANCQACCDKLSSLTAVVAVINCELPKVNLPEVEVINFGQRKKLVLTWAFTAVFILMITGGLFWQQGRSEEWTAESELLEQYVTVYLEN